MWLSSFPELLVQGQTDLEFSPLRPRARSSAMRSRLAFDSLWSRAANRADRLGTLSGRERPRIGTSRAGGLGMVLRQVGEGSAGRRAGTTRGELAPVDPVPAAHRLDHPGEIQSSKQASLPAAGAMGLPRRCAGDPGIAHCRGAIHAVPRPTGGQAGSQTRCHEATVGCLRIGPSELAGPGRKQRVVGHPVQAIAAAEIAGGSSTISRPPASRTGRPGRG